MADEIENAGAGWISDNSVDGIAEMLRSAIKDRKKYKEKSERALELSKLYNWESIAEKTHNEYLKLINGTR